jgi:hypothetical protein
MLAAVRWPDALAALAERHKVTRSPKSRRLLAEASSLSALYEADFAIAVDRIAQAMRLEPLNALHSIRRTLLLLRFGRHAEALQALESLQAALGGNKAPPLVSYLRALVLLRNDRVMPARNVAAEIVAQQPTYLPAYFLQAEAHYQVQSKGLDAKLPRPPYDNQHGALWTDLLVKLLLTRPSEGKKLVAGLISRGVPPARGTPEHALLTKLSSWMDASPDTLADALQTVRPGSRAEQILLLVFNDRAIEAGDAGQHLQHLRKLQRLHPARTAVRRVYVAALTRHAVSEARQGRRDSALRIVEACLRLAPHQAIHYQNRAALFTSMPNLSAYRLGWTELDRHHYRLALLGKLDTDAARLLARPHRMFAQQARLTPPERGQFGVFVHSENEARGPLLEVNQSRIDRDPEQLRQWLHHRRAELVFSHLALSDRAGRGLLWPRDPDAAQSRAKGLTVTTQSLALLVPIEGEALAQSLSAHWQAMAAQVGVRYAPPPADEEAKKLSLQHLQTLGDLALLCLQWKPSRSLGHHAEEILEFLNAEAPFFDSGLLFQETKQDGADGALKFLSLAARSRIELPPGQPRLTDEQSDRVCRWLGAELLTRMALKAFEDERDRGGMAVEHSLELLERARTADSEWPEVEFWSARIMTAGEHFDDARAALARFHRLSRGQENHLRNEAEELQKILDQKEKGKAAGKRMARLEQGAERLGVARAAEALEAELEKYPSSIQLHEEICRVLASAGDWKETERWSKHAVGRCLSRDGQLRARELHLLSLGLAEAATIDDAAARLFAAGLPTQLLDRLEALPDLDARSYAVDYLLGSGLLTLKRSEDAQRAFVRALRRCSSQMHLAVLRPLAFDVEQSLLKRARSIVDDAVVEGRIDDAFAELVEVWPRLSTKESCLADLARVQFAAVMASVGLEQPCARLTLLTTSASWDERLKVALTAPDPLLRVRRLALLAMDLYEPSVKDAQSTLRKADALEVQLALATALRQAAELQQARRSADALAKLDLVEETGKDDVRWLRLRAVALLHLERFDDADLVVARLATSREPLAQELCADYPALAFKRRITAATRFLRENLIQTAEEILDKTQALGSAAILELAFVRAFASAASAHQLMDQGKQAEARRSLERGLTVLEPLVPLAREHNDTRLIELRDRLDSELADQMEARQ